MLSSSPKTTLENIHKDPSLFTMIGNEKFEPLTLWNDNELRYRIIASQ